LLVSRDGTLWIGTYGGLSSWNGREFIRRHPEIGRGFVTSLLEGRDGTIWAGVLAEPGRLCAIRAGQVRCSVPEQGGFGAFVWSLAEDRAGNLWVGADTGVWRWSPGTPQRYAMPGLRVADLTTTVDGQVLAGILGGGLRWRASSSYPIGFDAPASPTNGPPTAMSSRTSCCATATAGCGSGPKARASST
jgi:ligand-binding sensor domain-containing protein